jgi:hypothetical protein
MRGVALCVVAGALAFAGCGSSADDEPFNTAAATTDTESSAETAPPAQPASPLQTTLTGLARDPAGVAEVEVRALEQAGVQLFQARTQAAQVAQAVASQKPVSGDLWSKWVLSMQEAGTRLAEAQQVATLTGQFLGAAAQDAKTRQTARAKQIYKAYAALVKRQAADSETLGNAALVVGMLAQQLEAAQKADDIGQIDPADARAKISQTSDSLNTLQQRMAAVQRDIAAGLR